MKGIDAVQHNTSRGDLQSTGQYLLMQISTDMHRMSGLRCVSECRRVSTPNTMQAKLALQLL